MKGVLLLSSYEVIQRVRIVTILTVLDGARVSSTLRLWRNGSCISVLKGHSGPVLCVCALENGDIVSGSGDSTLKKWIVSKTGCICESTWTGHTDTVRCLCALPGIGIVSGSHDTTLRMWTDTGSKIAEFIGHTALVYSVSANATRDLLVSGSEDNTVRVWNLSVRECTQIIDHPGCVWAVCILPGGSDFATGCADGVARVFTSDASRAGSADVVGDFTARNIKYRESAGTGTAPSSAGAHAAASNSGLPANLKLEDVSVLSVPGKRDGDIKCVNEMGVGVAYSWSATTGNWEKIGEITGGPGEVSHGNAKTYNGKQYDYLFDVDIGDGVPQRKLPFNVGENPHIVAQKWLEEQNLPETYREQVVDFIVQNTGGSASAAHMDPYQNVDPFTGSGAYQPLSSSGAAAKGASTQSNGAAMKHIPKRGMVYYDTLPFDNLRKKLLEFSEQINTTPMAAAHVECLDHILAALKDVAHYHSSSFRDQDYAFLGTLFQWPGDKIFPCIDIVRMVIFLDDGAQYFASRGTHLLETILSAANAPDASNPTKLVTLKLLCNCFKHKVLLEWLVAKLEMILNALSPLSTSDNKHIRLALANLLVNMSVHLAAPGHVGNPVTFQCCSLAAELLRHAPSDDEEVLFRSLVTIGTSVYASADMKGLIGTLDVKAVIERLSKSSTGKVGEAATSVLTVSK